MLEDRVVETANNPGQGDFELLGAVENNQTFVSGIGNGNTTRYLAVGAEGAEIGVAQVQAGSPDRLLRPGAVKNFDGTTTPVNFTGTVTVACVASVEDVLWRGADGDVPAGGGRDLGTPQDPWRDLNLSRNLSLGGHVAGEWKTFSGADIITGGANVGIENYYYMRIGQTAFINGGLRAGSGGGTSSDEILVNLPFPARVFTIGSAAWRASHTVVTARAPAVAGTWDDYGLRFFKTTGGVIVGTDLETINGEIVFSMAYEIGP